MKFSERLQLLIDRKKISQADLARAVNTTEPQVSNWLKGDVGKPQRKTLQKLADYFCCEIDWLATGKGKQWRTDEETRYESCPYNKVPVTEEEEAPQVRMYRKLAQMDDDTLGEIQTWINDMERLRPGFKSWFRLEFQNRFPEFDDWKEKITKKQRTGTGY